MDMRDILTVLFGAGAVGAVTFVVLYLTGSPGWWRSDTGRNLAAMMAVLAVLLVLVAGGRVWGPIPRVAWAILLGGLDTVIWWRVAILWRRQHDSR